MQKIYDVVQCYPFHLVHFFVDGILSGSPRPEAGGGVCQSHKSSDFSSVKKVLLLLILQACIIPLVGTGLSPRLQISLSRATLDHLLLVLFPARVYGETINTIPCHTILDATTVKRMSQKRASTFDYALFYLRKYFFNVTFVVLRV